MQLLNRVIMEKIYKVSFNLQEKDYKAVEKMAFEKNVPLGDIIRDALSYYQFMNNIIKDNGKILIEDKDENLQLVTFKC